MSILQNFLVLYIYIHQTGKENRAVGCNQGKENAERLVQRREELLNVHFDKLNRGGNDENVYQIAQNRQVRRNAFYAKSVEKPDRSRGVRTKNVVRKRPGQEPGNRHNERNRQAHAERGRQFFRHAQKRTYPDEVD